MTTKTLKALFFTLRPQGDDFSKLDIIRVTVVDGVRISGWVGKRWTHGSTRSIVGRFDSYDAAALAIPEVMHLLLIRELDIQSAHNQLNAAVVALQRKLNGNAS